MSATEKVVTFGLLAVFVLGFGVPMTIAMVHVWRMEWQAWKWGR